MRTKSINIFAALIPLCLCSCMQELVEKNYAPTVAGYKRQADESAIFAVTNKPSGRTSNNTAANAIPVLFTDPYSVGRTVGTPAQQQTMAPAYNSPYGSLSAAPEGTFNSGAIMPNTLPYYQQPAVGGNYYDPRKRQY